MQGEGQEEEREGEEKDEREVKGEEKEVEGEKKEVEQNEGSGPSTCRFVLRAEYVMVLVGIR